MRMMYKIRLKNLKNIKTELKTGLFFFGLQLYLLSLCTLKKKNLGNMRNLCLMFLPLVVFAACASNYNIQGSSNVSDLDGSKLYLKILSGSELKNMDSCEIVHGKFHFAGTFDSVRIANLFMDDENMMPLVIEEGDIMIRIDNTQQSVGGTPLNDSLFKFFNKYSQLKNRSAELVHLHDQAIMDGKDMGVVNAQLNNEAMKISKEEDDLLTGFVTQNFDNVLGPGVFFMVTIGNPYPMLTPWIEYIWSKASDKFKSDAYVKEYYEKAQENQEIMNGTRDVPAAAPPVMPQQPAAAPTPNELAAPAGR